MGMYRERPHEVEALQYDGSNGPAVAAWLAAPLPVIPGQWVVRNGVGSVLVMDDEEFRERYEPAPTFDDEDYLGKHCLVCHQIALTRHLHTEDERRVALSARLAAFKRKVRK